jgi:predicted NBD/HSP70 family sugar kinase
LLISPNLGWSDVAPERVLRGRSSWGLHVRLGNEADLAAVAVALTQPGRTSALSDFIYVSGGIGVGGATVLGGRVLSGGHGRGGEIGHVCVDPNGPACPCGSTGCLEQYAGWPALSSAAGLSSSTPASELAAAAATENATATTALRSAAGALGIAIASVLNVVDVPNVVLGGTFAVLADVLTPSLEQTLQRRVMTARWSPITVHRAPQIAAAGATGAALSVLTEVLADPASWLAAARREA